MAPTPTAPPVSEIGYVNPSAGYGIGTLGGWVDDQAEETAACAWPESNRTYNLMRRNSTVRTVLAAATRPVLRPGIFAIDPQGADPAKVLILAEDLDLPVIGMERPPPLRRRGRFSSLEHLRLSLLDQIFGHMAFELLCDAEVLEATGQARLHKLAPRFPRSIATIKVARDGGLEHIVQHRMGYEAARPIPVANLVWYANEREGAAWQGQSVLRSIYGNWLRLDRLLRARQYLMERQSMGTPVGKAPPGGNQDDIDAVAAIAQAARSGDQSGVGLPHGAELTFEGVRGTLPDVNAAIGDERAAMADALMASWLRLGTSEASGNRALGQVFIDQYTQAVDALASTRADVLTQHVVEDLWDWNYGSAEPAPAVVARPVDAERDIDLKDLVELVKVGAVTVDDSIEDFIRQSRKLPARTGPRPATAPAPAPEPPATAAGRRVLRESYDSARIAAAAATVATWTDRLAEVLSGYVDSEAIAAAALDGTEAQKAVAAGLDVDDTAALAGLLVELWGESYGAGAERAAATVGRSTSAGRPVNARGGVVMASLSSMIAEAGQIAAGILASLAGRLAGALGAEDRPDTKGGLADVLGSVSREAAAAERIAATETHRAMIAGAVDTWKSMGFAETRWIRASGSTESDECGDRDGTTSPAWSSLPPLHPNCACEVEPV